MCLELVVGKSNEIEEKADFITVNSDRMTLSLKDNKRESLGEDSALIQGTSNTM